MKQIGEREYNGQIIVRGGKYYGYPDGDQEASFMEREWLSDPSKALIFNQKLDDVTKVFIPPGMSMDGAKLIKVTKVVTIKKI